MHGAVYYRGGCGSGANKVDRLRPSTHDGGIGEDHPYHHDDDHQYHHH